MIAQADSSSGLARRDDFLGDAGSGVCVNAAKGDPETTECRCEAAGMGSEVSNLVTALSIQAPDTGTIQLRDADFGKRLNEVHGPHYCDEGEALCGETANLRELMSLEYICDKHEAVEREILELQDLETEGNETTSREDYCQEHEVQEREMIKLQKPGDEKVLKHFCKKM
jgi:hypothetical protein